MVIELPYLYKYSTGRSTFQQNKRTIEKHYFFENIKDSLREALKGKRSIIEMLLHLSTLSPAVEYHAAGVTDLSRENFIREGTDLRRKE